MIAIHDTDDDVGRSSSEEEFPDISNLNTTKARARAPIRSAPAEIQARVQKTSKPPTSKTAGTRGTAQSAQKEQRRQEKERAKQAKAADKQRAAALAEVNKVRTDKKVSTPEMMSRSPDFLE